MVSGQLDGTQFRFEPGQTVIPHGPIATLRRVQVFVEGSLDKTIRLEEMAGRAGLCLYHYARAFKSSAD
jgi:transcriptional regulator GlxA family with amidase domain